MPTVYLPGDCCCGGGSASCGCPNQLPSVLVATFINVRGDCGCMPVSILLTWDTLYNQGWTNRPGVPTCGEGQSVGFVVDMYCYPDRTFGLRLSWSFGFYGFCGFTQSFANPIECDPLLMVARDVNMVKREPLPACLSGECPDVTFDVVITR